MSDKPKFEYLKQVVLGSSAGVLVLALTIWGLGTGAPESVVQPTTTQTPTAKPTASEGGTCSIAKEAKSANLTTFTGQVLDLATGNILYDNGGSTPSITASSVKFIGAAAAMQALGPNFRISTKVVYSPSNPDTIILVGGGDPTLARGNSSVYKNAPKLSDLAAQVQTWAASNNITEIRHLVLDSSLFSGNTWDTSWPNYERTAGYQPLITALMVDGDRANPSAAKSARSTDPVGRAGREFKKALGDLAVNADITNAVAPSGATKIAEVKSAKLPTLISYMISASDNTLAEFLARHVAISQNLPANLQSIQSGYMQALSTLGLNWDGVVIKDGSGESKFDVVTPSLFNDLMSKVLAGDANLKSIVNGFPVAGKSGTLGSRFTGDNAIARGKVYAKTGSILHAYALVGYMDAQDGSRLAFAFFAAGPTTSGATRTALDTVTTAVFKCGLELGNG